MRSRGNFYSSKKRKVPFARKARFPMSAYCEKCMTTWWFIEELSIPEKFIPGRTSPASLGSFRSKFVNRIILCPRECMFITVTCSRSEVEYVG